MSDKENDRIKEYLRSRYANVASSVDPKGHVLNKLFEAGVLKPQQLRDLNGIVDHNTLCVELFAQLFETSHPNAFVVLKEALKKDYSWVFKEFENKEISGEEVNSQLESDGGPENPRKRKQLPESSMRSERERSKKSRLCDVQLIHRMQIPTEHQEVGGLAWMDNKIFVTFWNSENLLVFNDSSPFKQIDKIPLKQIRTVANMVAIEIARSIFVTCKYQKSIWKVKMPEKQVSKWPVEGGETQMLSVTPDDELLLTVHMDWNNGRGYCLDIYDPLELRRLKRVTLPIDSMKSWSGSSLDIHHALILSSGNIITSYQESRRVPIFRYIDPTDPNPSDDSDEEEDQNSYFFCELSPDGTIVRKRQMNSDLPTFIYLTQDDEEHVFVADCTNNTVFEMSSQVNIQLLAGKQQNIRGLGRICVGDNQRMIVAHAEKIGCFVPYVSIYKLI